MALDEVHLVAAARYVALNPVRARLVARAQDWEQDWEWSSARAHLAGRDDGLVRVAPLIERVGRFVDLIGLETDQIPFAALPAAESTGRPLGLYDFVVTILSPSWSGSLAAACGGGRPGENRASERSNWNLDYRKWVKCPRKSAAAAAEG